MVSSALKRVAFISDEVGSSGSISEHLVST